MSASAPTVKLPTSLEDCEMAEEIDCEHGGHPITVGRNNGVILVVLCPLFSKFRPPKRGDEREVSDCSLLNRHFTNCGCPHAQLGTAMIDQI